MQTATTTNVQEFIQFINHQINRLDLHQQQPKNLYEPASYLMNLGGKRLRPALVLAGYALFRQNYQLALPQALAVELFHNFTLAHDDIMDEAPVRRGKPTLHTRWNLNTAILSGDVIMIKAYQQLVNCPPEILPEIIDVFNQSAIKVCEGQQMDMDFETTTQVTVDEYLKMISLKTAALLDGSLRLGALRANADKSDVDLIGEFGLNLGIAFQLQDDILDAFGNPEKFGKQVGGDIIANKKTYLLLTALRDANPKQREEINFLMQQNAPQKVERMLNLFRQLNIKQKALEKMNAFYNLSLKNLNQINADKEKKQPLYSILDLLQVREI